MERLPKELLLETAIEFKLSYGQQVHINHRDCPAGADTKGRLYVKCVTGGIVGYCHHCGLAGFTTAHNEDGEKLLKWLKGKESVLLEVKQLKSIKTLMREWSDALHSLTLEQKSWLDKYECLDIVDAKNRHKNLMLPITGPDNNIIGFQFRMFDGSKQKYITEYAKEGRCSGSWYNSSDHKVRLFIVEDIISAIKIAKSNPAVSVLALLGTSLKPADLEIIQNQYCSETNIITVWLDSDKAGIIASAKLVGKLKLFCKGKVISITDKQPKEISMDELKGLKWT